MTKRFTKYVPDSYNYTSIITIVDHETNKRSGSIDDFVDMMNALNEENEFLKELLNKLEEFEVFESDRISGAVVTNNEYSVTLHKSSEAYMVCDMINRFIRGVKNGSKD